MQIQHLRIARPTERLAELVAFYEKILGFEVIAEFVDHEGFDGVMLGRRDLGFHLEFTHERASVVAAVSFPEQLLVFYLEEPAWLDVRARLEAHGVRAVPSHNPYWDRHGITIEDPDGHGIVLHRGAWIT